VGASRGYHELSGDFETHFNSVTRERIAFAHFLREMTSPSAGFPKTFSISLQNIHVRAKFAPAV
jgi:hypothetical protein